MKSEPRQFVWSRLRLPLPSSLDDARAALTAIAALTGQPKIVLEVVGRAGEVSWRLGCEAHVAPRVLAAMEAHLNGLRHERLSAAPAISDRAEQAAALRLSGARHLPLKHDATETAIRGMLAGLSQARARETVSVQVVLGPRFRPSIAPDVVAHNRRATTLKHNEHRFGCEVRIAASTRDPVRTRTLINGVSAALRALEVPGVRLHLTRTTTSAFSRASSPWFWRSVLSVSDLVPFTGWPLGALPLPGVPAAHPRSLPTSTMVPSSGRRLGMSTGSAKQRPIALSFEDSLRHLHIVGPTGVGKSTLMGQLALADMAQGRGVVVIDPKGDLVADLLARVPDHRVDDVVVLDARDQAPVGINPLRSQDPELAADTVLGVFHSLYADSWGPRTQDILHACLLTLARRGDASLVMVPLLLTNPGFRRSVVGRVVKTDPLGLGSFWSWFDGISDAERQAAIAPLMNKLRPVLLRPGLRAVFGQRTPRFDLIDVFSKHRILLVNLAKGSIGSEAAQLVGSLVVALLWQAALSRVAVAAAKRSPVMVHIDEVQDYLRLSGDLSDALAQARGLGVGFTLAHQHLSQLPTAIRDAVMANARSRVTFQLSGHDAREIAKTTRGELTHDDFEALPAFTAYASLLVSGSPAPWASLITQPLPPATRNPASILARSRAIYGTELSEIEADLLGLSTPTGRFNDHLGRTRRQPDGGRHD